ncbi:MAG: hypothetical protein GXO06_02085, partial [Epsilonproteobacteria bacterium]|nr:hypothetical protein [Campylobacterota bacterium]
MYYIYDNSSRILMADMDFIKILGFSSFSELSRSSLLKNIKIEREKLLIDMDKRAIKANFVEIELLNGDGRD